MKMPIAVVDDSAVARKMLIRSLPENWDVEISQGGNGVEALELYKQGKAKVMFLDLQMPVMTGYEVLESLAWDGGPTNHIIVVSADVQPEAEKMVLELGAFAFIKKPTSTEAVRDILERLGVLA